MVLVGVVFVVELVLEMVNSEKVEKEVIIWVKL